MPTKTTQTNPSPSPDVNAFYKQPILNSPYEEPTRHWEMDSDHQPTKNILNERRPADFITPVPKPKGKKTVQGTLITDATIAQISNPEQEYHKAIINEIRKHVGEWRRLPKSKWKVTPTTARLLEYWRTHKFNAVRPFFCQIEAVETAIWLTEVAPQYKERYKKILQWLDEANHEHNAGLPRLALKMATGSGKTTVMAMLIAWQTLNAVRTRSGKYSSGFLVISPGITIRDRLQVLKPNYRFNYYKDKELVPPDMMGDIRKAKVIVTNFHAFMLREKLDVSKGTRGVIEGWREEKLETKETPGEMIQRVMPDLARMKNIIVINDEAHHCYKEKSCKNSDDDFSGLKGSEKTEAQNEADKRNETARVWFTGIDTVRKHLGISKIYDLSATPFFLAGSGYQENTIFPWAMSDFSLMDAIECGIVKLPRIPVSDNVTPTEVPIYRNLWENIKSKMPRKKSQYNPQGFPPLLTTAVHALYGHYEKTFKCWQDAKLSVPPCFIVVCNNTNTSKQFYDYISGYHYTDSNGNDLFKPGACELFSNYEEDGTLLSRPRTLLIDSAQLERGGDIDDDFRKNASDEIERFKRDARMRGGRIAADLSKGKDVSDADLLREVMNTVGKKGQLGEGIRCVVSVGMLSEGWDANNVTHILGVRAFGTQLLCEQVIGRALRRQSYETDPETGLFRVEYADALGIPFDFSGRPDITPPPDPVEITQVRAVSPERDRLEITFPRVAGYRTEVPDEILGAIFTDDSTLELTPERVGPTDVETAAIIGERADLDLKNLAGIRDRTILMYLTKYLLETFFKDKDEQPKLYLYGQLKKVAWEWMSNYLKCGDGIYPAILIFQYWAIQACEKIKHAIDRYNLKARKNDKTTIQAIMDTYNPIGTTMDVNFRTTKRSLYETDEDRCHINYAVCDFGWETSMCRILEKPDNHVFCYAKNHNLGFEVPYRFAGETRMYRPDFIARIDDGGEDLLNLVIEVKGRRTEEDKQKRQTMENLWIPAVNNNGNFGRWAFLEIRSKNYMEIEFTEAIERLRNGKPAMEKLDMELLNG